MKTKLLLIATTVLLTIAAGVVYSVKTEMAPHVSALAEIVASE